MKKRDLRKIAAIFENEIHARPKSAWMLGYVAAMRADAIELTDAGERAAFERARERYGLASDFAREQFRAGWQSVIHCERRAEVPS